MNWEVEGSARGHAHYQKLWGKNHARATTCRHIAVIRTKKLRNHQGDFTEPRVRHQVLAKSVFIADVGRMNIQSP